MASVHVPGALIQYERAGSGPPLLYLSGTGSDLRRPPGPFTWPQASHFDQVAYDHRGFGRSLADDPLVQPTMADFAADALALCDYAGWESFSMIGISFGGMVAQEVAIRAGARVRSLVLACTSSGGAGGASAPLHELLRLPTPQRSQRLVELIDRRTLDDPSLRAEITELMAPLTGADPGDGLARQLAARRHHDTWDRLGVVAAATLVAAGRFDDLAPLENSRALAGTIPGARLEVFEGGHRFLFQDPRAWHTIGEFLRAHATAGSRGASQTFG
jgi:3-oxoadipate enol-lactonase